MSASDLELILADALRDAGHPTPGLEAQKLLFHLARVAGGERVTIPSGYAARVERDRAAKAMQGLPVPVIAERLGCCDETVYRALRSPQESSAFVAEAEETVPPKEPHGGGD